MSERVAMIYHLWALILGWETKIRHLQALMAGWLAMIHHLQALVVE
jgi:hypothetical protein